MKITNHPLKITNVSFLFDCLGIMVDGIASTFGRRCEVVLHDLSNLKRSIVKIANGHVTGRTVGGSITDQGLQYLKNDKGENLLISYQSTSKDGRFLKSSTFIFRNDEGKPIAAMCVNFDVTDILNFNSAIQDIFGLSEESTAENIIETFQGDINSTLNEIAQKTIRKTGKSVSSMGRADKIEIIRSLDESGFFLIKGAIKFIAAVLNLSKYSIYNYLETVRTQKTWEES